MNNLLDLNFKRIILKLRYFRQAADVGQREAAEKLNLGYRSYQRIENGESSCDISFLHRFCHVFNVDFVELASPSPPKPYRMKLYSSENEIREFENLAIVTQTNFLNYVKRLHMKERETNFLEEFDNCPYPFCFWTPSKKIFNASLIEALKIKKNHRNNNFIFFDLAERINALDSLYYYKPKYSVKRFTKLLKDNSNKRIDLYSVHFYSEYEISSFSLVMIYSQ